MSQIVSYEGVKMGINYGVNKVRFTNPVPVGKRVRARAKLASAEEKEPNALQVATEITFEIDGEDKPVCVAETLTRLYF
jgi:acyl dehydratase